MPLTRRLSLRLPNDVQNVDVSLSDPAAKDRAWVCRYEIPWPEGPQSEDIWGADAVQALYLAMQAVALALYASPHHEAGRLYWQKPGMGYGFPMPKAGLSELVGEDRVAQVAG